jgi:hypothetical protein
MERSDNESHISLKSHILIWLQIAFIIYCILSETI